MQQTQAGNNIDASKEKKIRELAGEIKKHISSGKYKEALDSINRLLEILPDDHGALMAKVQLLVYFKKLRDADKLIDRVIEKYPRDPYAYLSRAIITVLYSSNIKEAISHLDAGIDACPDCFELLVAKAQMLYWLGDSSYNLWIERAERLDKARAEKFLQKYWVENLPVPASYPIMQLHGLISNILFLISQQGYDGRH